MNIKKKKAYILRIDENVLNHLKTQAFRMGTSTNVLIGDVLTKYVNRQQRKIDKSRLKLL
jgi:hypothetical protein